ncbi:uncharacterized protein DS421_9g268210 [Arachis hypogaea]|nr:uncharacterized protein DS421_9g268210 [Arachis hypogaea]
MKLKRSFLTILSKYSERMTRADVWDDDINRLNAMWHIAGAANFEESVENIKKRTRKKEEQRKIHNYYQQVHRVVSNNTMGVCYRSHNN